MRSSLAKETTRTREIEKRTLSIHLVGHQTRLKFVIYIFEARNWDSERTEKNSHNLEKDPGKSILATSFHCFSSNGIHSTLVVGTVLHLESVWVRLVQKGGCQCVLACCWCVLWFAARGAAHERTSAWVPFRGRSLEQNSKLWTRTPKCGERLSTIINSKWKN